MAVTLLAGGTGAAKLARGLLDVIGSELTVIANTGDDIEIHGGYVSPDPDLVSFWLADSIDERGWGLAGDSFTVMEALRSLGSADVWFQLGDRDLAICLYRRARLDAGARLTQVAGEITASLGVSATVLPMSDEPVRTRVRNATGWHDFQRFMIVEQARGPVTGLAFDGAAAARPTPEVIAAIEQTDVIVIGPSNPFISIGPILAVPAVREAIEASRAPVVAVSPLVGGKVVKGPTDVFMEWAGSELSSDGIAEQYAGLIDGLVADALAEDVPTLVTDVSLGTPDQRSRVASEVLAFAAGLAR